MLREWGVRMLQSKRMSLMETVTSTCIGLVVSIMSNCFIFWAMSIPITVKENLGMTAFFTVISIIRGYFVRRLFNRIHAKQSLAGKKNKCCGDFNDQSLFGGGR